MWVYICIPVALLCALLIYLDIRRRRRTPKEQLDAEDHDTQLW